MELPLRTINEAVSPSSFLSFIVRDGSTNSPYKTSETFLQSWQLRGALALTVTFAAIRGTRFIVSNRYRPPRYTVIGVRLVLLAWILSLIINMVLNVMSLVHSAGGIVKTVTQFGPDARTAGREDLVDTDESPRWAKALAKAFFLDILNYECIVRIYLLLYPKPNGQAPKYHHGSIDGDYLWAAVLHLYWVIDLVSVMLMKWLQMIVLLCTLASNMAIDNPDIEWFFAKVPKVVHWLRRSHLLWSLALGNGVPWLLWAPDTIVLGAAVLFYIGVLTGAELSPNRVNRRGADAMRSPASAIATNPRTATLLRERLTADQEDEIYSKFINESIGNEDGDDFEDELWMSEAEEMSSRVTDMEDIDSDVSSDEINDILNSAFVEDDQNSVIDESYLCPDRIFTRQMRKVVLANDLPPSRKTTIQTNAAKVVSGAATAVKHVAERVESFRTVLASHAPVTRAVDHFLTSRSQKNRQHNTIGLYCVVCTSRMRDIILQPCNHLCLCEVCKTAMGEKGIGKCPVCFEEVKDSMKIFWS